MKITLKRTPEQVELIKAMASRNKTVAYEAQVALAEFIGPVLAEVLNQAPTVSNLFQSLQFNADDNPSIPLDLYYDISDEDYVQVWSQSHAGGLPTSQVLPTASELKLATYQSAVGSEVAQNILSFEKTLSKAPSMESIIENPQDADFISSEDTNIRFAVTGALLQKVREGDSKKRKEKVFSSAIEYLNRFESKEFTVFFTQHGIKIEKDLVNTKSFTDFSLANTEIDFV